MKLSISLKTLAMLSLTTLSLAATSSQAQTGYIYFGGNQAPNPWAGAAPNVNPWMNNQGMQQARHIAVLKQRQIELDQRQDAQMQRILKGMDHGKLTSQEAAGLIREHLDIANLERRFLADGRLGPNEMAHLEKRLDEAAKNIKWEIRDRERTAVMERPGDNRHPSEDRRDEGRPGNGARR